MPITVKDLTAMGDTMAPPAKKLRGTDDGSMNEGTLAHLGDQTMWQNASCYMHSRSQPSSYISGIIYRKPVPQSKWKQLDKMPTL